MALRQLSESELSSFVEFCLYVHVMDLQVRVYR